jgi:hypothetical protein
MWLGVWCAAVLTTVRTSWSLNTLQEQTIIESQAA